VKNFQGFVVLISNRDMRFFSFYFVREKLIFNPKLHFYQWIFLSYYFFKLELVKKGIKAKYGFSDNFLDLLHRNFKAFLMLIK
jgi:hypothetical protein